MSDSPFPALDLDPCDLARAILADPQAAESVQACLAWSDELASLVRFGGNKKALANAAERTAEHNLAVRVAVVREATKREFYAAHPEAKRPKAMAPEETGALKMRALLSKK